MSRRKELALSCSVWSQGRGWLLEEGSAEAESPQNVPLATEGCVHCGTFPPRHGDDLISTRERLEKLFRSQYPVGQTSLGAGLQLHLL